MLFNLANTYPNVRKTITDNYARSEQAAIQPLFEQLNFSPEQEQRITQRGVQLIEKLRRNKKSSYSVDALMQEFSLGDEEGIALMCLAEALLRIPDEKTRDDLIQDKLSLGQWQKHIRQDASFFTNAASYGLLLGKKISQPLDEKSLFNALMGTFSKLSAPIMRAAMVKAMQVLGTQFVTGTSIENALNRVQGHMKKGFLFSFDMLGEAAMTQADAERYYNDYRHAIETIGKAAQAKGDDLYHSNGISVKLSAIHPRYTRWQYDRVMTELYDKLKNLMLLGKKYQISINIDAEEANRLELSLDLLEKLLSDPDLEGYDGIGFVIQAYSKRCPFVIDYVIDIARKNHRKLMVRLVKGAYWDSEIKWAQTDGLDNFPLYTRKNHTDISYIACAEKLLAAQDVIFPQFATHNIQTLSTIYEMAGDKAYEFQCLHGMGEDLYSHVVGKENLNRVVRIYAPVGTHQTLLAYLVRRLLENGANSSFVHQLVDKTISPESLMISPWQRYAQSNGAMNKGVKLPHQIFPRRNNSKGFNLYNENTLTALEQGFNQADIANGQSILVKALPNENFHPVENPADHTMKVGEVAFTPAENVKAIVENASNNAWSEFSAEKRAGILNKAADLYEENAARLMKITILEAGKTLANAVAELREAVDFLRYYAEQLLALDDKGVLSAPRGKMVCISPWNFPLAIFTGQIAANLAAGNAVIAKPAEQTSLIAYAATQLLHQAGVPVEALQLVLGAGDVGAELVQQPIDGVVFTGSTEVANAINRRLATAENDPILVAETGGQNVLVVDSSALPEQVVADVLQSAFDSAGQRCSALRVLLLQEDIAEPVFKMIGEAMQELQVGDPRHLATDVGPVIDGEAQSRLNAHKAKMQAIAKDYVDLAEPAIKGSYVTPAMYLIDNLDELTSEVFGPVLHVLTYKKDELGDVLQQINAKGFALTGGCHSRIRKQIDFVERHLHCGNFYINRNIVGAVVGVQPFGGHSRSGTGPKAGGELYLQNLTRTPRFYSEFGTDTELAQQKPLLDSITGEANTLAYLPCEVLILNGELAPARQAAIKLLENGFSVRVRPNHPLAKDTQMQGKLHITESLANCQKGVFLVPLTPDEKVQLAEQADCIFKCTDWQNEQDLMPLYNEFSRSENTTAAGGNASLMAASED